MPIDVPRIKVEQIRGMATEWLDKAMSERSSIESQWEEFTKLWNVEYDPSKDFFKLPYSSFTKLPSVAISIKQLCQRVEKLILPATRPFDAKLVSDIAETKEIEQQIKNRVALIDYQLMKLNDFRNRVAHIVKQYILYGVSPIKIFWYRNQKKIYGNNNTPLYVVDTSYPKVTPISIFNFYVYPASVDDIENASAIFEISLQKKAFLKRMAAQGYIDANSLEVAFKNVYGSKHSSSADIIPGFGFINSGKISNSPLKRMKIDPKDYGEQGEYAVTVDTWVKFDVDNDGFEEWLNLVFVNNAIVRSVIDTSNLGPPYIVARVNELPHQFYQHSVPRFGFKLQYLAEAMLGLLVKNAERSAGSYIGTTGLFGEELTLSPDRLIKVPSRDSLFPLEFPDRLRSVLAALGQIDAYVREVVGGYVAGSRLGTTQRGARTLGGMGLLVEEAQNLAVEIAQDLENQMLVKILERMDKLNSLYIRNTVEFMDRRTGTPNGLPLIGEVFTEKRELSPSAFSPDFRITYNWLGSLRILSETAMVDGLISFLQIASKSEGIITPKVKLDIISVLRRIYGAFTSFTEAEKVIQEVPENSEVSESLAGQGVLPNEALLGIPGGLEGLEGLEDLAGSESPEGPGIKTAVTPQPGSGTEALINR